MNRERFKSVILMFLVMMNFVLGAKILTDKKLWPYGYNFFVSLENFKIIEAFTGASDKQITKTHLTMPEQIIVNTGDQTTRIALNSEEEIFPQIFDAADEMIVNALRADTKDISFSPKREWVSVLNGNSVCFNYAVPYDTKLMGDFFGVDASGLFSIVPSFSRIAVAADKSVYFEDYKTGNFYRVDTAHTSDKLDSIINKVKNLNAMDSTIINYSVDLKFDEAFGSQKAVLSPTVPVYSTPVKKPMLFCTNPLLTGVGEINRDLIEKLLPVFRINTNTMRRYTEVNGTLVFVENNGILKINPNGVLSYQSTDSDGFPLSSGSYIETISALADFSDKVNDACLAQRDLYVSTPMSAYSDRISFDYRANGVPVYIGIAGHKNAISAEIKQGALKSYVQVLRKYTSTEETFETAGYIESLDHAIENYSKDMNNIEISRVFLGYRDDGAINAKQAEWMTEVKSIVINEEELK